jgi:hypothetical protein
MHPLIEMLNAKIDSKQVLGNSALAYRREDLYD